MCIFLQVKDLQDSVSFYLESSQEPDFLEDENMYDDLQIDDVSAVGLPHANAMHEEEGPLSPAGKLATTPLKSTSQELFDDRRRGRMDSTSSDVRMAVQYPSLTPVSILLDITDSGVVCVCVCVGVCVCVNTTTQPQLQHFMLELTSDMRSLVKHHGCEHGHPSLMSNS